MERTRPAPSHRLFSGLAGVLHPALAQKISCSIGQAGPHVGGQYINEGSKLSLALPERFLCSFPIIDVHRETVPLNDLALGITQRFAPRVMPSVLSICSSQAVHYAECLSSVHSP